MYREAGFTPFITILAAVIVIGAGVGGFLVYQKQSATPPAAGLPPKTSDVSFEVSAEMMSGRTSKFSRQGNARASD